MNLDCLLCDIFEVSQLIHFLKIKHTEFILSLHSAYPYYPVVLAPELFLGDSNGQTLYSPTIESVTTAYNFFRS